MRNIVYFFVFDGYADWEAALALCEIRRPGDYRVRTVGVDRKPVQSMGGLTILPDLALDEVDTDRAVMLILPGGTAWERGENATGRPPVAYGMQDHRTVCVRALCSRIIRVGSAPTFNRSRRQAAHRSHKPRYRPAAR